MTTTFAETATLNMYRVTPLLLILLGLPGWCIAAPSIAASAISTDTTSDTNHNITLPSGITAGDLLIVFMHGSATDATPNTAATGWTICRDRVHGSSVGHLAILTRFATGSEGSSITATTDLNEQAAAVAVRITGWHGTTGPECSTGVNDSSAGESGSVPNPDALSPSWGGNEDPGTFSTSGAVTRWSAVTVGVRNAPGGDEDTLWIAAAGIDNSTANVTAFPTNYNSNQLVSANSGSGRAAIATFAAGGGTKPFPCVIGSGVFGPGCVGSLKPQEDAEVLRAGAWGWMLGRHHQAIACSERERAYAAWLGRSATLIQNARGVCWSRAV